ncbi:unnamed protein product [Cylicocyclus nassatus]|uniref:Uncharacterized protein n=1 Tax=Cylicocyclus nassatus TaxID=53992 RepID=A0AA36GFK0_CYLNA|nr:unnamed protein product [Cylicocyclus nassatus]
MHFMWAELIMCKESILLKQCVVKLSSRSQISYFHTGTSLQAIGLSDKNTLDLMEKDLAEFGVAMTQEVTDLTNAAKGGIGTATHVIKEQAQYLEKLVAPDVEENPLIPEVEASPPLASYPRGVCATIEGIKAWILSKANFDNVDAETPEEKLTLPERNMNIDECRV